MSMGYARGYVDRTATTSEGPIRFVAATEGRKADGIDLRMAGAQLDRFRSNPVFLYGHRYMGRDSLPIGRGESVVVDHTPRLLIDVTFDSEDSFATEVERKYRAGYLNAVSIGFDVLKWEGGKGSYWTGGVAEEWDLLELSAVPVPMDAGAVVESGRGLIDERDRAFMREMVAEFGLEAVARALHIAPRQNPHPTQDDPPAPPADEGINPDAARDLLAAITLPEGDPSE